MPMARAAFIILQSRILDMPKSTTNASKQILSPAIFHMCLVHEARQEVFVLVVDRWAFFHELQQEVLVANLAPQMAH